jgi:hypothetical protein
MIVSNNCLTIKLSPQICFSKIDIKITKPLAVLYKLMDVTHLFIQNQEKCVKNAGTVSKSNRKIVNKGNNKITELRTILQRERQNSFIDDLSP